MENEKMTRTEAMRKLAQVTEFMRKQDPKGFAKIEATVARRVEAARKAGVFGRV